MKETPTPMSIAEIVALHDDVFAPWIKALRLQPIAVEDGAVTFLMPESADLTRRGGAGGGVVCGQAVSAAGDTTSVLAITALNGRLRACTTVDLTAHFMRPLPQGDVDIRVETLSNGRRMAVARAEFRAAGSPKLAATVTCTFAYLED